jgi:hypothetical protein
LSATLEIRIEIALSLVGISGDIRPAGVITLLKMLRRFSARLLDRIALIRAEE